MKKTKSKYEDTESKLLFQKKVDNFIVLTSDNYKLGEGPLGTVYKALQEKQSKNSNKLIQIQIH